MAKIIIPAVTFIMTAGFAGYFSFIIKKLTPIFATVKK